MKPDNNVYRKSSITRSVMLLNCFGVFIILRYQILLNKSNLFFYKVNNNRLNKSLFPHLSKCHPTPILPQTSFFSRSITYTLKIRKQNYLAKFRKKPFLYKRIHKENIKHHTLHHYTKKIAHI